MQPILVKLTVISMSASLQAREESTDPSLSLTGNKSITRTALFEKRAYVLGQPLVQGAPPLKVNAKLEFSTDDPDIMAAMTVGAEVELSILPTDHMMGIGPMVSNNRRM